MTARENLIGYALVALPNEPAFAKCDELADAYRAEVLAEAKTEIVAWLVKKAREGAPVEQLASKVDRGAVRVFIGTGHFRDAMDAHHDEVTQGNADWLEGIGQDHAAEMLRHSLEMDAEIAATEGKASTTTVPTATPDFFQPGHGYTHRAEVLRDFLSLLEQSAGYGVVENLLAHNPDLEQLVDDNPKGDGPTTPGA